MNDPAKLIRKNIRELAPYSTARDEYDGPLGIYLDANENPYDNGVNRYPDPRQRTLKARIAELKGVPEENIFIGNGSDEPIDLVFRTFCEPGIDNAVSIAPTYGMYKVAAAINNVEMREVGLKEDFSVDTDAVLRVSDGNSKLLFLCSPNNPTGNCLERAEIERLLREFPGIVVLDEAYIDFADEKSFLGELDKYPNLIILQTLSKAWGMAGLRLGLAFARKDITEILSRVKYPYNINVITQQAVLGRLGDDISAQVEEIKRERGKVVRELAGCPLIERIYPSDANFILVKTADPKKLYDELIAEGVIVRDRSRIKGCEGCLRITIGTPEENRSMTELLQKLSKNGTR